jgi:hypothetical protein
MSSANGHFRSWTVDVPINYLSSGFVCWCVCVRACGFSLSPSFYLCILESVVMMETFVGVCTDVPVLSCAVANTRFMAGTPSVCVCVQTPHWRQAGRAHSIYSPYWRAISVMSLCPVYMRNLGPKTGGALRFAAYVKMAVAPMILVSLVWNYTPNCLGGVFREITARSLGARTRNATVPKPVLLVGRIVLLFGILHSAANNRPPSNNLVVSKVT